jgi:hypothetical protein
VKPEASTRRASQIEFSLSRKLNFLLPLYCMFRLLASWRQVICHHNSSDQVRTVTCRWCSSEFFLCRRCWRGQSYCSMSCRMQAKAAAHRRAQRIYRQTARGKQMHREAEKRRRMGMSKKSKQSVADAGTRLAVRRGTMRSADVRVPKGTGGQCARCGRWGSVCVQFPRRGYGLRMRRGTQRPP